MSNMVVNTNVLALNSHRALKNVGSAQSKASERLSTGLRINRAADDASGLAISEKMRSQIRGLDQASANAQDGISLIQTAEGALQTGEDILQTMRELVVRASNLATNQADDRDYIAMEVDEYIDELEAISEKTEFNKKKLINGDWSKEKLYLQVGANSGQKLEFNIEAMNAKVLGVTKTDVTDIIRDPSKGITSEKDVSENTVLMKEGSAAVIDLTDLTDPVNADKEKTDTGTYKFADGTITVGYDGSVTIEGAFNLHARAGQSSASECSAASQIIRPDSVQDPDRNHVM